MSDQSVPGNSPEARTETGELKDGLSTQQTPENQQTTTAKEAGSEKDQTQEGKKPEEGEKKADDKKAEGPPEKYEFKAPEGYELNEKVVEEATAIFKDLNLSQEQANKLFDFYAKQITAVSEAPFDTYENMRADWRKEAGADKEIGDGAEGLKPEVRAAISKSIDALGPDLAKAFRTAMDLTGVGDNPTFVKAINAWSKFITEGRHVNGGSPSKAGQVPPGQAQKSAASTLFPNLPSAT